MNYLIIIPARKNSKRIKNKNVLKLGGKKLIEHTIEFAKKVANLEDICLSTDSKEIKNIAKSHNIVCQSLRPKYLSRSDASSADVSLYEIDKYEKLKKKKIDYIILFQPTSPFRSLSLFNKTKKIYLKNLRPTYSVSKLNDIKYVIKDNRKKTDFLKNYKQFYEINGNMYFISKKDLLKNKSFFKEKNFNISIFNSKKYSIDVDTIYDFEEAKKFI